MVQRVKALLEVIQHSDMPDKTKNMETDKETEILRLTDRVQHFFPFKALTFQASTPKIDCF